jgi:proteasome lid subunit RPN8/RPN11
MAVMNEQLPAEVKERDAARLRAEDFPRREFPGVGRGRQQRYQVAVTQAVMDDIYAHGQATDEVEVCGVLLGTVYHDAKGPWCLIDASVRGNFSAGKETQVTITSETWTHVNSVRDRQYPDKKFIGWYHTHPGFGIFLSGMDDFIQANWFAEPWQIALVYDPKSREEGVFIWRAGKTENEPFFVLPPDGGAVRCAGQTTVAAPNETKLPSGTLGDLMSRLQATERRQRWMMAGLAVVGLIALIWPLAVMLFMVGEGAHPAHNQAEPTTQSSGALPTAVRPPSGAGL